MTYSLVTECRVTIRETWRLTSPEPLTREEIEERLATFVGMEFISERTVGDEEDRRIIKILRELPDGTDEEALHDE